MTPAFFLFIIPYLAELAFIFPVKSGKLSIDTFSMFHLYFAQETPTQRPKGVSGRGMRVPPFFCV
ncbi:hypothetical protein C1N76_11290 [Geobacillus thermoleovorans]|uniref:Uncharacterized protein n=1 Tax=Geobacillus thermoleovorans TaxID=33941 RepID=A0A2Z3N807_GEOTH|nr:hypothetical protein C1N76_11290 [Geobacillus thermoleovorans]QCK83964.1 hypothetical protein E5Z46_18170 [Geobacillus kaustophilus NBRC 102445]RXS88545.1 hypothetical protein ETR37_08335 [Geobacillus sp. PK12]